MNAPLIARCGRCQHLRYDHPGAAACVALERECPCPRFQEIVPPKAGEEQPPPDEDGYESQSEAV